jgi:hypothetical protein
MSIKKEVFKEACISVGKEFLGNPPLLIGANHEPRFALKPALSAIASKYMYYRVASNWRFYSAKHIHRLAQVLDVSLDQLVSFG